MKLKIINKTTQNKAGVFQPLIRKGQRMSRIEIDARLKRRYLDRLKDRMRVLRVKLVLRDWEAIHKECHHISQSAPQFGFGDLGMMAEKVTQRLQGKSFSRARPPQQAKLDFEALLSFMDCLSVNEQLSKSQ